MQLYKGTPISIIKISKKGNIANKLKGLNKQAVLFALLVQQFSNYFLATEHFLKKKFLAETLEMFGSIYIV